MLVPLDRIRRKAKQVRVALKLRGRTKQRPRLVSGFQQDNNRTLCWSALERRQHTGRMTAIRAKQRAQSLIRAHCWKTANTLSVQDRPGKLSGFKKPKPTIQANGGYFSNSRAVISVAAKRERRITVIELKSTEHRTELRAGHTIELDTGHPKREKENQKTHLSK